MKNIRFKELVTDNVFDFCAVLSAIGYGHDQRGNT